MAEFAKLGIAGGKVVGYTVVSVGPRGEVYAGPFTSYRAAEVRVESWNKLTVTQRQLADLLYAALNSFDPFDEDAPNLNSWPQPGVQRELAMWLAARVEDPEPDWRCECGDLNRHHESFCYRCGAGQASNVENEPSRK